MNLHYNPWTALEGPVPPPDWSSEMAGRISRELARKKDALISEAITARIGPDWTPQGIAFRLTRHHEKNQPQEVWCLDGRPMLEIWPAYSWTVTGDDGRTVMNWSVEYRRIG